MFSIPILKQDFRINIRRLGIIFGAQFISLLIAMGICEMGLIEVSDIFWDTIPVVIIPWILQMVLAYEVVFKRKTDGTFTFLLASRITPAKLIDSKMFFIIFSTLILIGASTLFGCVFGIYRLTGVWSQASYLFLNLGGFCLQIFIGGFCFLMAVVAKKSSLYLKLGVGLPILQYALFLGYFLKSEFFFLKFVTVFTLFDHTLFSKQSALMWVTMIIYLLCGSFFYALGRHLYLKRKDAE